MHTWTTHDTLILVAGVLVIIAIAVWFSKVFVVRTSILDKYAKSTDTKAPGTSPVEITDPFELLSIDLDKEPYVLPEGCEGIRYVLYFISGNDRQILETIDLAITVGDSESFGVHSLIGKMVTRLYRQKLFRTLQTPFPIVLYTAEMNVLYEVAPKSIFEAMVAIRKGEEVKNPTETYSTVHRPLLNKLFIATTILAAVDKSKRMD